MQPHRLSISEMSSHIRARRLSPVELVDAHLEQIHRQNQALNAFVVIFTDEARAAAREAERLQMRGEWLGPLHGIPVTIKDSFDMRGIPTYCGSRLNNSRRPAADAAAVKRMRRAGAVILGKTNTPEFLMNYETDNHIVGRTNNPWNLERTPGGSSGGESAAIASFCSAGGVGSDGGGSVRIPAHCTGIAALKPTPGRVSAAGHLPEIGHPGGLLGVAGPMARNARDLRTLFEVLSGYDIEDPFSVPVPLRAFDISNIRIGVMEQFCGVPVQPPIRKALLKAAVLMQEQGMAVHPFQPRGIERAPGVWWFFFVELAACFTRQMIAGREDEVHWTGREFVDYVAGRPEISGVTVVENLAARDRLRASMLRQMEDYPAILLPACGAVAWCHRQRRWETAERPIGLFEAMAPATPFNLFGFPGVVVPVDITEDGLPVGVQIVGRPYEEELILQLAERLEQARGPFPAPPGV